LKRVTQKDQLSNQTEKAGKRSVSSDLSSWKILENLGESVAIVDRKFRIIWINEPILSNFKPRVNPVGQFCYSALFNRKAPCNQNCPVKPVLTKGKPYRAERRVIGPDGEEQWREARAYPILDSTGEVGYVARISFDITSHKREESKHKQAYERLNRSLEKLKGLQIDQFLFQAPLSVLTGRELEVIRLIAQGQLKPVIAKTLGISINTVKAHVTHIFNKLGVNDRAQAAVWAARHGLV
jgi:DNA-binding CsgD family transcriptional regulator